MIMLWNVRYLPMASCYLLRQKLETKIEIASNKNRLVVSVKEFKKFGTIN